MNGRETQSSGLLMLGILILLTALYHKPCRAVPGFQSLLYVFRNDWIRLKSVVCYWDLLSDSCFGGANHPAQSVAFHHLDGWQGDGCVHG